VSEAHATGGALPAAVESGFVTAMSQSLLLPAVVIAVGVILVACFAPPVQRIAWGQPSVGGTADSDKVEDVAAGS
jgi:hypothetical protein